MQGLRAIAAALSVASVAILTCAVALMSLTPPAHADSSARELASYYERHMALDGDVAYGWIGSGQPRRLEHHAPCRIRGRR